MYRLYTEDLNRDSLVRTIGQHFPSFTLIPALGYWQGQSEASLIIEIATEDSGAILKLTESIRILNSQSSVLVSSVESSNMLVSSLA